MNRNCNTGSQVHPSRNLRLQTPCKNHSSQPTSRMSFLVRNCAWKIRQRLVGSADMRLGTEKMSSWISIPPLLRHLESGRESKTLWQSTQQGGTGKWHRVYYSGMLELCTRTIRKQAHWSEEKTCNRLSLRVQTIVGSIEVTTYYFPSVLLRHVPEGQLPRWLTPTAHSHNHSFAELGSVKVSTLSHTGNKQLTVVGRAIHGRLSTWIPGCFLLAVFRSRVINFIISYCSRSWYDHGMVVSTYAPPHRLTILAPPPGYQRAEVLDREEGRRIVPSGQLGMAYEWGLSTCPWSRTLYVVSLSIRIHRMHCTEYGEGRASRIWQSDQHRAVLLKRREDGCIR